MLIHPWDAALADRELLVHLARPNPVWPHLEAAAEVRLVVVGDDAFIPGCSRADPDGPEEQGVPTSHYGTVHAPDFA